MLLYINEANLAVGAATIDIKLSSSYCTVRRSTRLGWWMSQCLNFWNIKTDSKNLMPDTATNIDAKYAI